MLLIRSNNIKEILLIVILLSLYSCSILKLNEKIDLSDKMSLIQTEEAGTFQVSRESGFNKDKMFVVKTEITKMESTTKVLEKNITISEKIQVRKNELLRPVRSESIYFLNDQKYTTRMELDYIKETIKISMKSPEDQWNGEKSYTIPKGNGGYCFYHNLIECMIISNFFKNSVSNDSGEMNFMLVWEGYPYFHEQFLNLPGVPITDATITFDGKNNGLYRFILSAGGQSQFYLIDKNGRLSSHYWSSQGYSRVRR